MAKVFVFCRQGAPTKVDNQIFFDVFDFFVLQPIVFKSCARSLILWTIVGLVIVFVYVCHLCHIVQTL